VTESGPAVPQSSHADQADSSPAGQSQSGKIGQPANAGVAQKQGIPKYLSIALVIAFILAGVVVSLLGHIRIGASLIGAAPITSGVFRLRYHSKQVPWVVSRSAGFDISASFALGVAVWAVAWVVPQ